MAAIASLAGRRTELEAVTAVLTGETANAALVVLGEAGIGKSRLVAVAARQAAQAGVTIVSGWCLPQSHAMPLLPVVEALHSLSRVDDGTLLEQAVDNCPGFVRGELARLLPELDDSDQLPPAAGWWDAGFGRQRLFDAVWRVGEAVARQRRVALVVEDLHWADPTTFGFLDFLLSPGRARPVPLVLTCRTEYEPTADLTEWLEHAQRLGGVRRLDLAPLTEGETVEQVTLLMGRRAPDDFVHATYTRSEGNAFFTEQLVAFAGEDRASGLDGLPPGLSSLLLARTAPVSGLDRLILINLAVAARPLDEAALAALCNRPAPEVRAALHDLTSRHLLRRPAQADGVELRHALLAEAVVNDLLADERKDVHVGIAQLMAAAHDPALASDIAEHFAAAGQASDELRWRAVAAQEAETKYASREAAIHRQRVIALWDLVPNPEELTGWELATAYLRAFTELQNTGSVAVADALAEEALTRLAGNASPETAVSLYRAVGLASSATSHEAGLAAMRTAIQVGERIPPTGDYVRCLREYAGRLGDLGLFAESRAHLVQALHAARALGDLAEQKLMHVELAWLSMAQGDVAAALDGLDNAKRIVLEPANPNVDAWAAIGHADILLQLGDLERAIDIASQAVVLAERGGYSLSFRTHVLRDIACEALVERGDVARAAAIIDPFTSNPPSQDTLIIHGARADLELRRGNHEAAGAFWNDYRKLLISVPGLGRRYQFASWHLEYDLWSDDPTSSLPETLSVLEQRIGTDAAHLTSSLFVLAVRACADAAELARTTGDGANLQAAQQAAARVADLHDSAKIDPFAEHSAPVTTAADHRTWNAEWQRLRGESDAASWGQAAAAWEALTRPHRAAYARWRQAEALLARPVGRTAATEPLRRAAAQASQHVPLSNAIRHLARRARIELTEPAKPPNQVPGRGTLPFGLTDRELSVLTLVAQGKTNREIGAELFISTKTASVHVTNILRKLRVDTRVQAATLAERAGLLNPDVSTPAPTPRSDVIQP